MGSIFGFKIGKAFEKKAGDKPPVRPSSLADQWPEASHTSEEIEDHKSPMVAPEVDLISELPDFAAEKIAELLAGGCRAFLVDPEEHQTRWFAIFDDHLQEIGRTPISKHTGYLKNISQCESGAVSVEKSRYRLEVFVSFNEFGDRFSLQFFEEGRFSFMEAIARRQENVRLVNRLKPASSLTAKNEEDMAMVVAKNPREESFSSILIKDGLITKEEVEKVPLGEDYNLHLLQSRTFSRKMAAQSLANYLGVPYVDVERVPFSKKAALMLPKEWELEKQAVPYAIEIDEIKVAMMDPTDKELASQIEETTKLKVIPLCASAQDIVSMVTKAYKKD